MRTTRLPFGGTVIHTGTEAQADEHDRIIKARAEFTVAYAQSKGWPNDPADMTIDQILEIRDQEGWKNP